MYLHWTDKLSVGIDQFDDDHKRLIGIVNELNNAIEAAGATGEIEKEEIDIVLNRLENYTKYHCDREEAFMEKTGYPGLNAHKQEHVRLEAMIANMREDFRESVDARGAVEIMRFISHWVTHHIFITDKKYTAHLQASGHLDDSFPIVKPADLAHTGVRRSSAARRRSAAAA
jgi:hemerythrin-like metal-binding protein